MYNIWYLLAAFISLFIFIQFVNFGAFAIATYLSIKYSIPLWFPATIVTYFWIYIGYVIVKSEFLKENDE